MKRSQKAFTLVELIIVIAVIGVLAAILIPVFSNVIDKANSKSALSDARNTIEQAIAEAADHQDMPENIVVFVKKAGNYYIYGYNRELGGKLQQSQGNPYRNYADIEALNNAYGWHGTGEPVSGQTYDLETDGAYYLVPTADRATTAIRGITALDGTYTNITEQYMQEANMGDDATAFHGILLDGTWVYEDQATSGSNPGQGGGSTPGTPVTPPTVNNYNVTVKAGNLPAGEQSKFEAKCGSTTADFTGGEAVLSVAENTPVATIQISLKSGQSSDYRTYTFDITSGLVTGDMTLTATWDAPLARFTLTFDADGGTLALADGFTNGAQLTSGTDITDIVTGSSATKTGTGTVSFKGWRLMSADGNSVETLYTASSTAISLTRNFVLKAAYDEIFTVTFTAGEGATGSDITMEKHIGDDITLPDPTGMSKTGYIFRCWKHTSNVEQNAGTQWTVTGADTFTAQWTRNVFYVRYYDGDTHISGNNSTYDVGTTSITLNNGALYQNLRHTLHAWEYIKNFSISDGRTADVGGTLDTSSCVAGDVIIVTANWESKIGEITFADDCALLPHTEGATISGMPSTKTIVLSASNKSIAMSSVQEPTSNMDTFQYWYDSVGMGFYSQSGNSASETVFTFTDTNNVTLAKETTEFQATWSPLPQSSVHEIWNETDFRKIGSETGWDLADGTQYKLMADFSFSSNINGLGTSSAPFEAEFDGNGHTITVPSGVTLALGGNDAIFYAVGEHSTIKNLTVNWQSTTQVYATGAIAGYNGGLIENCTATGTISVKTQSASLRSAGGICFWNESTGRISGCLSSVNLTGSYGLGGIAATNEGTIEKCGSTGNINPNGYSTATIGGSSRRASTCGGLVSENTGTIDQCWCNRVITGNYAVNGGLVGYVKANTSVISNCYFFGYVNAGGGSYGRLEGGLVGAIKYGTIRQCYSIGRVNAYNVSDSWYTYGYKYNDGTWQGNYWHKGQLYQRGSVNTNYDSSNTDPNDSGACGLANNQWGPANSATFTGSGYSTDIWDFTTNYPTLKNNPIATGITLQPYGMTAYVPPVVRSHNVTSKADFEKIGVDAEWNLWDNYTQTADIDMGGAALRPIGYGADAFSGTYDGGGHKISNFNFNVSSEGGLFTSVTGTIRNLWADTGSCTITGASMGILAYDVAGSALIENCGTSGTMTGTSFMGGFVDQIQGSATIRQCWSNAVVTATGSQGQSGVLLAACDGGTVQDCVVFGSVSGSYVGGIVGYAGTTTFNNVYSLSKVNRSGSETYSRPTVGYFGGNPTGSGIYFLKGMMYNAGTLYTSWDTNSNAANLNGKGLTSAEFTTATMTTYSTSVWDFSGSYPKLINAAGINSVTVAPYAG